uniref:Vexin n=1 Tax=Ailuropoda melanoleuca TaxID=9646 RepID=A0A7N5JKT8_AILME
RMHQIYSCSDENIEVFTTVIPSKVSSPARRRVKSSQHLLTKNVVIESDLYTPRPLELLPHRSDRRDGEGRRSGRLHGARPQGPHLAKAPARPDSSGGPDLSESPWCAGGGCCGLGEWRCSDKRIQTSQEDD